MPIFEDGEEVSQEEIERQQVALNSKVGRKKSAELFKESLGHSGGDCWENEDG